MSILGENRGNVVRDLEQVFGPGTATGLSEGQLLRRFVAGRDESAFSTLVSRHGAMVLGVCRRVLGTIPDADDAFQATFLVLLRRANALQDADSLGPWLYGVAWRVASRARACSERRRLEEEKAAKARPEGAEPDGPTDQHELRAALDEEINRLPERYRRPLVLCYVEGLTQEAAARRLRWSAGVLRGRLDRARSSPARPRAGRRRGSRPGRGFGLRRTGCTIRAGRRTRYFAGRDSRIRRPGFDGRDRGPGPRCLLGSEARRRRSAQAIRRSRRLGRRTARQQLNGSRSRCCPDSASPHEWATRRPLFSLPGRPRPRRPRRSHPPIEKSTSTSWTAAPASRSAVCA